MLLKPWPARGLAAQVARVGVDSCPVVADAVRLGLTSVRNRTTTVVQPGEGGVVERFGGKIGVVTGGGTGMGRELVRQLSAEGCHVAMCDVSMDYMDETKALALAQCPAGTRVTTFVADVADEEQM